MWRNLVNERSQLQGWLVGGLAVLLALGAWWMNTAGLRAWAQQDKAEKPAREAEQKSHRDATEKGQQPRPEGQRERALPDPLADLEDFLKEPPPGVDPQQWEALRQMLRRQREEMRQMLERLQRGPLGSDRDLFPFRPFAPRPGRLGVVVEPLHPALRHQLDVPENQGLLVREVTADSPAAKAGIKPHDILLAIGDKTVPADPDAFVRMVAELPAGKVGKVVVLRKSKKETLGEIELPEWPRRPRLPQLRPLPGQVPPGGIWLHVERSGDGSFTVQYRESGQAIRVEGQEAEGKVNVSKIEITEGGETKSYKALDELPASLREKVSQLLDSALKGKFFVPQQQPRRFD